VDKRVISGLIVAAWNAKLQALEAFSADGGSAQWALVFLLKPRQQALLMEIVR